MFVECVAGLTGQGFAVLVAAHDLSLVARYCDRLVVMVDARLVDDGPSAAPIENGTLERAYGVQFMNAEDPAPNLVPWHPL